MLIVMHIKKKHKMSLAYPFDRLLFHKTISSVCLLSVRADTINIFSKNTKWYLTRSAKVIYLTSSDCKAKPGPRVFKTYVIDILFTHIGHGLISVHICQGHPGNLPLFQIYGFLLLSKKTIAHLNRRHVNCSPASGCQAAADRQRLPGLPVITKVPVPRGNSETHDALLSLQRLSNKAPETLFLCSVTRHPCRPISARAAVAGGRPQGHCRGRGGGAK